MSEKNEQAATSATAFNERASLVIYAENAAAMAVAAEIVKQLGNQDVDVKVRRAEAPLPRGSWGC
ncbi:MAG: hypothetical protein KJ667_05380 [Alphaproteobacteria bacterium]|nr:hypothetical protein [Alphaproteobacteria bacterium]